MNSPPDRHTSSTGGNFDLQHPKIWFGALHESGSKEERVIRISDVEQEVVAPHPLHGQLLEHVDISFALQKAQQVHLNPNEFHNMPLNYTSLFNKLYAKTEARRNEVSHFTR